MKKKVIFVLIFITLIGGLKYLAQHKIDTKGIEEHLNSIYTDYTNTPDDYIITKGTIVDEYSNDYGFEVNFYGETSWLIEVTLSDGTVTQTDVLRDEKDKIGDVIDIAYLKMDNNELKHNMNATQLHYVEMYGVYKSVDILNICIKVAMGGMVAFAVFIFAKKRMN